MLTGIVPKMAIRFTSYEWYKQMLADKEGKVNSKSTFMGTSMSRDHNLSLNLKALRFNPRASAI